jgi:TetR/AcrR family transcriptional repressor of nem operon
MMPVTLTAKDKLLNVSLQAIRSKGYDATSVDDLCKAAGVTKGAFFHHFKTKEELGVAAALHWNETTGRLFEQAPYHHPKEPIDRIFAYLDFRATLIGGGSLPEFTCLLGTMVQETFETSPAIRDACEAGISGHAATLEADIQNAMDQFGLTGFTASSLALHTQTVLQGAFILAKAKGGPQAVYDAIAHLRRYFELLFAKRAVT